MTQTAINSFAETNPIDALIAALLNTIQWLICFDLGSKLRAIALPFVLVYVLISELFQLLSTLNLTLKVTRILSLSAWAAFVKGLLQNLTESFLIKGSGSTHAREDLR